MNILIVAATEFEILPLLNYLKANFKNKDMDRFFSKQVDIHILITGVGMVHTTFALTTHLQHKAFDLVLNLGIAGALNPDFEIGQVFQVVRDQFADLGVEEADGSFSDVFDMQLLDWNEAPFINGKLYQPNSDSDFLPKASAITVNKVHGTAQSISKIKEKYPVDLESMEGAAVFYVCQMHDINCLQVRAVSNYVEPRNKDNWNIPLAIDNLNQVAQEIIEAFDAT